MNKKYSLVEFELGVDPRTTETQIRARGLVEGDSVVFLANSWDKWLPLPGTTWLIENGTIRWKDPHPRHRFRLMNYKPVVCVALSDRLELEFSKHGNEWISSQTIGNHVVDFCVDDYHHPLLEVGPRWACAIVSGEWAVDEETRRPSESSSSAARSKRHKGSASRQN
jgi:hypothetical protein